VVVTGAASGIGRATAQLFAAEGAVLALVDRDKDGLARTAEDTGGSVFAVDITDEEAMQLTAGEIAGALGGIDGVVNAAGIMFLGAVADVPAARWRALIEVNLTGTYIVVRSCLPWLTAAPAATIVNVASAQGLLPNSANVSAYAASKGGVINLTRVLAAELAPQTRVNSVCPGMVDTPMAAGNGGNVENYAMKRMAEPTEIARAILFLTNAESSFITGTALAVDGGRSFH
jgi:NAD(P)-dependent dehydrogenase (short-subunit alcohol dehydrogenase family)